MAYLRILPFVPLVVQFLFHVVGAAPTNSSAPRALKVISHCTVPNTVALTFDDGPYKYLRKFADLLSEHGAKGTFFFNGDNYDCIYDEERVEDIQYAFDKGHQVGSHTWHHADLGKITSKSKMTDEFIRTETALKKILGVEVAMTRPPYGSLNSLAEEVAAEQGQTLITWDLDTRDADGASVKYSKEQYEEAAKESPSNILALNHEPYNSTLSEVIPYAFEILKDKKYKFVTVAECLGMEAYHSIGSRSTRDKTWKC
ncbi:carbohydrate esterase family 4 protein [Marasmius fiardii PR-910]|nr:carbohydrate esterase family 4 protein [Marasmius fiardii PR-910]